MSARIGFRFIYERLLEGGKFTGLGKTPAESVRIAPIDDTLSALSIENAMSV